jgi:hypothetical protein
MYLRFKKRLQKGSGYTLNVEIIESYRDAVTGEPRNRFVAYLGAISEQDCANKMLQEKFWRSVEVRLAALQLSAPDEQHIRDKLLERVPRPKSWQEILAGLPIFSRGNVIDNPM